MSARKRTKKSKWRHCDCWLCWHSSDKKRVCTDKAHKAQLKEALKDAK